MSWYQNGKLESVDRLCKDSWVQMNALRETYQKELSEEGFFKMYSYLCDEELFDLCASLWDYTKRIDHNCCGLDETNYGSFIETITKQDLSETVLAGGMEWGDPETVKLWVRIEEYRKTH